MDAINFVYWLQGYMELCNPAKMHQHQIDSIKAHINLVLHKVTPPVMVPSVLRVGNTCTQSPNTIYNHLIDPNRFPFAQGATHLDGAIHLDIPENYYNEPNTC